MFTSLSLTWDPTVRLSLSAVTLGTLLHKIQSNDVNQMSIQRFMSLPDKNKVKQCLILFTIFLMFLLFCCCYMGLLTYATYYDCDPLSTKVNSPKNKRSERNCFHFLKKKKLFLLWLFKNSSLFQEYILPKILRKYYTILWKKKLFAYFKYQEKKLLKPLRE